jgi:hypothetical protein
MRQLMLKFMVIILSNSFFFTSIGMYILCYKLKLNHLDEAEETLGHGDGGAMALLQGATPIRIIAHPHAKSFVWQHFGFVPLGDSDTPDRRRVLCRLCLRELPYCGNTTNLQYHLQRYHRDVMPAGLREMRPSPRTARRASRLPDPIGDPGKIQFSISKLEIIKVIT